MALTILIDSNHSSLVGHFPGSPIVPGVVLLECLERLLEAQYPKFEMTSLPQAKFSLPVLPNEALTLTFNETKLASHGVIQFVALHTVSEKTGQKAFSGKVKLEKIK